MPDQSPIDQPSRVSFTADEVATLREFQLDLVRRFGSTRAAAAANLIAVGMARARGVTTEQHAAELVNAYEHFNTLAAGGGDA